MTTSKKTAIIVSGVLLAVSVLSFPKVFAYQQELINNHISIIFDDSGPVTTAINIRLSLWRLGDPEANEIDENGDIVTTDVDYGNWQDVITFTPDSNGKLALNLFDTTDFPTFPEIDDENAYLQVEFKYPAEENTAYRTVDMLDDSPDFVKRSLLVPSLSDLSPQTINGGTPSNSFTLDINYNAPSFIELIFGQTAKKLIYDIANNWFNLNARFNINGFSGIKFAINAHADDSETQLFSIRNSGGTAVLYIDEDGDITTSGTVDGKDISTEVPKVWRGGIASPGYQTNVKTFARTITATSSSGIVTAYITNNDADTGTKIFSNIYSVSVTAEKNELTAANVPFASVKSYNSDTGKLDINVVEGNSTAGIEFETDQITLHIQIIGD